MLKDVNVLREEVKSLQTCLNNTFVNRIKAYWSNSMRYHQYSFQLLHWITYVLLPATPQPKIMPAPVFLGVSKTLSLVKK